MSFSVFSTSFLILVVFCYFGVSEPPPSYGAGYGPASPVEFGGSHEASAEYEQYSSSPSDFGSHGSYSAGAPSYSNVASTYKSSGGPTGHQSFGSGGVPNYRGGGGSFGSLGSKGSGSSTSYINIVHGPPSGGSSSFGKTRPAYSAYSGIGGPQKSAYSGSSNFASLAGYSPSSFNDGTKSGANNYISSVASGYSSGQNGHGYSSPTITDGAFGKGSGGYGSVPSYASSAEIGSQYSSAGSDFGSDDVGSYSSGGPTYVSASSPYTKSAIAQPQASYSNAITSGYSSPTGSRGSGAYSTTNFIGQAQYSGRIGHEYTPQRYRSSPPTSGKGYARFGSSSGPVGSTYSSAETSLENSPFSGRALKSGYAPSPVSATSAENDFSFPDGGDFKVQSSYSGTS